MDMNHEKTLKLLAKALEIAPGDWETRSHMAALCIELGRKKQAALLISEAPRLPDDAPGRVAAAELLARADAVDAALELIDALLAQNRANAKAHLLKAKILRDREQRQEARKHYHIAAVIDESLEDREFEDWIYDPTFEPSAPQHSAN